jgi:GT2 family glycosyltransferase
LNGALSENAISTAEVETVSGAFMLVRTDAWHDVAGFDTSFFMYSEEMDLCHRLRKMGWLIMMTPHAEVIHLVGSGEAKNSRRIELITTAKMHFLRKHWSLPSALFGGMIVWAHALLRVALGYFGGSLIGNERALRLRQAYSGVAYRPRNWWYGFGAPPIHSGASKPTDSA